MTRNDAGRDASQLTGWAFVRHLPRALQLLLLAAISVAGYGLGTWLLAVAENDAGTPLSVLFCGVPIPFLDPLAVASAILACGTAALAYSAFLQFESSETQAAATEALATAAAKQVDAAERSRLAMLRASLSIVVVAPPRVNSAQPSSTPVMSSTFSILVAGSATQKFRLRNMGPGNAVDVSVECPVAYAPGAGPWTGGETFQPSGLDSRSPRYVPVVGRSVMANEDFEFELPLATAPSPSHSADGYPEVILTQGIRVVATGKDVEGNPAGQSSQTIRLLAVIQTSVPDYDPISRAMSGTRLGYELVYSLSNDDPP